MDLGLSDRACIVTGGSRGIGLQAAKLLSAEGAKLLLVGRSEPAFPLRSRRRNAVLLVPMALRMQTVPPRRRRLATSCFALR